MSEKINAYCDICGKGYHLCRTCQDVTSFTPWRVITDTAEHYKIFLILSEYTKTKDKNATKEALSLCDLSELESFRESIKKTIKEIMAEEKNEEKVVKHTTTASTKKIVKKTSVKSATVDKEKNKE